MVDLVAECPTRTTTTNASMWSLGWIGGTETPRACETASSRGRTDDQDHRPAYGTRELPEFPEPPHRRLRAQYEAENLPRLIEVRTRYDASNVFHNRQSVPPLRSGR